MPRAPTPLSLWKGLPQDGLDLFYGGELLLGLLHPINDRVIKFGQLIPQDDFDRKLPKVGQQLLPLRTISKMDYAWTLTVFIVWWPSHGMGQ
jgi:hypothetical protein